MESAQDRTLVRRRTAATTVHMNIKNSDKP